MRQTLTLYSRRNVSVTTQISPPVSGWNAKDAVSNMRPDEARVLDNWFPRTTDVIVRAGATDHSTGYAKPVKSLISYNSPAGGNKIFAATDDGIFDATSSGAVGSAAISLTNGYVSSVQTATSAGTYSVVVNGTDTLKLYNGSTWMSITGSSTPAITGVATSELSSVALFKKRLFFTRKDSRSIYYLNVDSIGGALTEYPCGAYLREGGFLVAMGTWTLDAGEGADDHFVVVSSEGEMLVFKGTNPGDPTAWGLVGVFNLGAPLGKNCFVKYGGDLIYLNHNGAMSLTKALSPSAITTNVPFSDKIIGAFSAAAADGKGLAGWCGAVVRGYGALLINVPISPGTSVQFVMNTLTGAWCRFTGWNANCMVVVDDQLYMGDEDSVFKALYGVTDFGDNVQAEVAMAYNYFSSKGRKKKIRQLRPVIVSSTQVSINLTISTDFDDSSKFGSTISSGSLAESIWDTAIWGASAWGGATTISKPWIQTPSKAGYCHSVKMRVSSKSALISWTDTIALVELAALAP